jgi:Zn-dependent protease with chaperone function
MAVPGLLLLNYLCVLASITLVLQATGGASWLATQEVLTLFLLIVLGGSIAGTLMSPFISKKLAIARLPSFVERVTTEKASEIGIFVRELSEAHGRPPPRIAIFSGPADVIVLPGIGRNALMLISEQLLAPDARMSRELMIAQRLSFLFSGNAKVLALLQGAYALYVEYPVMLLEWIGAKIEGIAPSFPVACIGLGRIIKHITRITLYVCFGWLSDILIKAYSRYCTYLADWHSADLIENAAPLQRELASRIRQESTLPAEFQASGFVSASGPFWLINAHPPMAQRVLALEAYAGASEVSKLQNG